MCLVGVPSLTCIHELSLSYLLREFEQQLSLIFFCCVLSLQNIEGRKQTILNIYVVTIIEYLLLVVLSGSVFGAFVLHLFKIRIAQRRKNYLLYFYINKIDLGRLLTISKTHN